MKERTEKAAEKKKMKELLKKLKHQKQAAEGSDSDENMSDFSVHDESDDDITIDPNKCYKCDGTDNASGWIGCQRCFRFYHRRCTDVDFSELTEEEIEGFPFEFLYC